MEQWAEIRRRVLTGQISKRAACREPSLNKLLVAELMRGEYLLKRENILLMGNTGTGKTHIATALGIAACSQGKKVRFYRVTELITELLESCEERTLLKLKKQLSRLDLLILDELGYVLATARWGWNCCSM